MDREVSEKKSRKNKERKGVKRINEGGRREERMHQSRHGMLISSFPLAREISEAWGVAMVCSSL